MGKLIDETGNIYGYWTVLKSVKKDNKTFWLCECECGTQRLISGGDLRRGHTKSCGCKINRKSTTGGNNKPVDLTNQRFGKLIALYPTDKRSGNNIVWHCKCDCGNEKDISSSSLKQGLTKSCGCLHKAKMKELFQKDIIGKQFGLWTVLEEIPERTEANGL